MGCGWWEGGKRGSSFFVLVKVLGFNGWLGYVYLVRG